MTEKQSAQGHVLIRLCILFMVFCIQGCHTSKPSGSYLCGFNENRLDGKVMRVRTTCFRETEPMFVRFSEGNFRVITTKDDGTGHAIFGGREPTYHAEYRVNVEPMVAPGLACNEFTSDQCAHRLSGAYLGFQCKNGFTFNANLRLSFPTSSRCTHLECEASLKAVGQGNDRGTCEFWAGSMYRAGGGPTGSAGCEVWLEEVSANDIPKHYVDSEKLDGSYEQLIAADAPEAARCETGEVNVDDVSELDDLICRVACGCGDGEGCSGLLYEEDPAPFDTYEECMALRATSPVVPQEPFARCKGPRYDAAVSCYRDLLEQSCSGEFAHHHRRACETDAAQGQAIVGCDLPTPYCGADLSHYFEQSCTYSVACGPRTTEGGLYITGSPDVFSQLSPGSSAEECVSNRDKYHGLDLCYRGSYARALRARTRHLRSLDYMCSDKSRSFPSLVACQNDGFLCHEDALFQR